MLNFDTSRAVMRLDHQQALIRAAYAASAADETIWLEWKSSLDLSGARKTHGFFTIAKAVLGFANRMPDKAACFVEGHAYVLVGVQPGSLQGVEEVDSVELHRGLEAYLGKNGPNYRATYVPVDLGEGLRQVLFVGVAPPRWGDPIYCLRKGYENKTEGAVFVRYPNGATEQARGADFDLLNERARRVDQQVRLAITVESGTPLRPIDANKQYQATWLDAEQAALDKVRRQEEAARAQPTRGLRIGTGNLEQFDADVAAYLATCRKKLFRAIALTASEHLAPLRLRLSNLTQMNLADVAVELHLPPGRVAGVHPRPPRASNESFSGMPQRPQIRSILDTQYSSPLAELGRKLQTDFGREAARHAVLPRLPGRHVGLVIRNGGSAQIRFDVEHLRPSQSVVLEPVVLLFHSPAPDAVTATWSATCKNVDGVVTGDLRLETAGPAWTINDLLTEPAKEG